MSYWTRIANVFRGDGLANEINEEIEAHIAEAKEAGRDPDEVRRAFGSKLRHGEQSRDFRLASQLDSLRADVVFGWRQLLKYKTATVVGIVSLGLAMGACISAFRLMDALLLRPLPVAEAGRLFIVTYPHRDGTGKAQRGEWFDYPQFRVLRDAVQQQAELVAISQTSRHGLTYGSDDEGEQFQQQFVSGWMFKSFGLRPAVGRLLSASDDVKAGGHPVAVLSYNYWRRRFGGDSRAIGRKFRMGAEVYQIVGVCEKGFTGTEPGRMTDLFVPTMMNAKAIDNPHWGWFRIWVRVKPGVAPEVVRQKLRAAVQAYREEAVKTWRGAPQKDIEEYKRAEISLDSASMGVSEMQSDYRTPLAALGAIVALVLLIACANVANLMTGRAAARDREMALRTCIGAGRGRLVQLVMIESALMGLLASLLGGVFAWWSAPFVVSRIYSQDHPAELALPADVRVLGFGIGLVLVVTLLFGLMPALRASGVKPVRTLRGGDGSSSRRVFMSALVAVQVTFCFLIYLIGGLFVTTLERLSHQPTGFTAERLLTVETVTWNNEPSVYWEQVQQRLQSVNGVESAAICGWPLLSGNAWTEGIWVNGNRPDNEEARFLAVSPGWFHTMQIPLKDGRDLRAQDAFPGYVVVNQAFARRYFDGRNAVGRKFQTMDKKLAWSEVVGLVGDARYLDMREAMQPTVYVPIEAKAKPLDWATFMVRTNGPDPMAIAASIRREVSRARPEFRVVDIRTQTDLVEQHTVRERLLAGLSLFFAAVAVVLAGVGLYGVLSYSVLQRRKEIGIRIALGAGSGEVAWRVTANVLSMLALGAAAGLMAGLAAERYLKSVLDILTYDVKASDPAMLGGPVAVVFLVGFLAALPPVMRAVRLDPAMLLRAE